MTSSVQTAITDSASIATALGVLALAAQTAVARAQARSTFEGTFTRRFNEIEKLIPLTAFFADDDTDWPTQFRDPEQLRPFYAYFQLCEEEMYYRSNHRRISGRTWNDWLVGMEQLLRRRAFHTAWDSIIARTADPPDTSPVIRQQFAFLRRAIDDIRSGVRPDPARWKNVE